MFHSDFKHVFPIFSHVLRPMSYELPISDCICEEKEVSNRERALLSQEMEVMYFLIFQASFCFWVVELRQQESKQRDHIAEMEEQEERLDDMRKNIAREKDHLEQVRAENQEISKQLQEERSNCIDSFF